MRIDIYCDESRPELFAAKKPEAQYLVIGSLWMPSEKRDEFKAAIHQLRDKYKVGGEFKWLKISPSRLRFYCNLVRWFVDAGESLRFRCIAVDREKVDLPAFHDDDQELGFYKFYYQTLLHWLEPRNNYKVFCDYKDNRKQDRLKDLHRCLQHKSPREATVEGVQSIRSEQSVLIQLVDVLTGVVSAKLNWMPRPATAKARVIEELERSLGRSIHPTGRGERKFNVFMIELGGRM